MEEAWSWGAPLSASRPPLSSRQTPMSSWDLCADLGDLLCQECSYASQEAQRPLAVVGERQWGHHLQHPVTGQHSHQSRKRPRCLYLPVASDITYFFCILRHTDHKVQILITEVHNPNTVSWSPFMLMNFRVRKYGWHVHIVPPLTDKKKRRSRILGVSPLSVLINIIDSFHVDFYRIRSRGLV